MTTYDVIIDCDQVKAEVLYKFLKFAKCSGLRGSNLSMTYQNLRPPAKAYRIYVDSRNKYRYAYSLTGYEITAPIRFDKFMERTVKI